MNERRDFGFSKVKYLGKYINGYPFAPSEWTDAGKPIIRIQNLTNTDAPWNRSNVSVPPAYEVVPGDILISWSASLGVHVWDREPALLNQHIFKAIPNTDLVERGYYVWAARWFIEELQEQAHGSTMQHLTKDVFGGFRVPLPPRSEQIRIANFLDEQAARIDALIAEKERLLHSLEDAAEAYAFHLATEGTAGAGVATSRNEGWLARVPAHWATPKLGYFADVGNGATPKREVDNYWLNGTVPWVTSTAVNDRVITSTAECITDAGQTHTGLKLVRPGSAIVGLIGQGPTRGMTAKLAIPATVSQNVAYVTSKEPRKVSDDYLIVVLTGLYTALRYLSDGSGGAQGAMNCETLHGFRVPIAPPSEQEAIVDAFRSKKQAIKAMQEHAQVHIGRLREYRSSLISAVVNGQMQVPGTVGAS
jgi:type I restriction enzyme S subunit